MKREILCQYSNKFFVAYQDMFREIMKDLLRILAEVYKVFSLESSIHGFRYTILIKTKLERYYSPDMHYKLRYFKETTKDQD